MKTERPYYKSSHIRNKMAEKIDNECTHSFIVKIRALFLFGTSDNLANNRLSFLHWVVVHFYGLLVFWSEHKVNRYLSTNDSDILNQFRYFVSYL